MQEPGIGVFFFGFIKKNTCLLLKKKCIEQNHDFFVEFAQKASHVLVLSKSTIPLIGIFLPENVFQNVN